MKKWHIEEKDGYSLVINEGGRTLSFDPASGVKLLEDDGFAFKDLNGNGKIDPYEDWRLPISERVADLLSQMTTDEKLSMMLHAGFFLAQKITPEALEKNPALRARFAVSGLSAEDFAKDYDHTKPDEAAVAYMEEDGLRFWLLSSIEDPASAAKYTNNVQRMAEKTRLGIPVIFSTNPRAFTDAHSDLGEKDVTSWPTNMGIGATFDPKIARFMAETVAEEYRAMGITMELGPQVDVATDPRWNRFNATYGSCPALNADLGRAVCDGYQTNRAAEATEDGWGAGSVMAMAKHWPGSTGEGGRESHSFNGRFAIYPGNNFAERMRPWTDGVFKLDGPTGEVSSVMSCYDVIYGIGGDEAEDAGSSFNHYTTSTLLREKLGFDGFVCTDFWITGGKKLGNRRSSAWGMVDATPEERALKQLEAGIDQLGGLGELAVLKGGYELAVEKHGKDWADARVSDAAERILKFCFRVGSFENPYSDPETANEIVGSSEHQAYGLDAHRKSVVMLKNDGLLPIAGKKVYIADKYKGGIPDRSGTIDEITCHKAFNKDVVSNYFTVTDTPEEADIAFVLMDTPQSGNGTHLKTGEVIPISLQYGDYTATHARKVSVGGSIVNGKKENLSYRGKTVSTYNKYDLDNLIEVKKAMKDKPVVAIIRSMNPCVPAEFEPLCSAVIMCWGSTPESVIMEALSGQFEPSGLLPFQMPKDMDAVEAHLEDTPFDIDCYRDSAGNTWDFGFGLNWSGTISDKRTEKYKG